MNHSERVLSPRNAGASEMDLQFLGRLLAFFWREKALFISCGFAAIVVAAVWMRAANPVFQAQMTLLPNPNENSATVSKASNLGSLLDLGLGGGDSPNFVKFVETLRSYRLAERLQDRHQYLQRIFPELWNESDKTWKPKRSVLTFARWVFLGRKTPPPDVTSLQDFIKEHMVVDEDKKNHSLLLSLHSTNPALAVNLLTDIHMEADELIRDDSRNYTQHAIDYLNLTLRDISAEDHRRALTALLIEYERTLILVSDKDTAFASIVVDPATLASSPVSPKALIVYLGCLFFAFLAASAITAWRARSTTVD